MPTFVVSLFLPYTVDFSASAGAPSNVPHRSTSPSRNERPDSRSADAASALQGRASLFAQPNPTPPRTPAVEHADFFSQLQPSAATHFPKPHDPRSLVRSDSHIPEWMNSSILFNQPRSRAGPAPPEDILEYVKRERAEEDKPAKSVRFKKSPPRARQGRESSTDRGDHDWQSEWEIEPAVQGNGGLANAMRAATNSGNVEDVIWVGTVGFPTDSLSDQTKGDIYEKLESEYDALPVYVSDSDFDGHYAHYCKTILWPVFHYQIPDHPKSKAYEDHSFNFYVNLNQAFADSIVRSYKRGDIIWIHDYHLLLVPGMVRKKLPDAQIGFFLHTAFPSSEVFRCLAVRKELLEGMLGANLVAFQNKEYAEHFLTTCTRLLIVEATSEGVQLENHFVNVINTPIGIDPEGLYAAREEPAVKEWIGIMQERYKGKKLIVARDKLDHVRGVRQKLLAFELFLNKYPQWRDNVILIQVATSTTENAELAATVSDIVTRIDSQHSTLAHQPLVFLRQDIAFSQYLALLSVADALVITSLREGMNLTCHEYVICQDGKSASEKRYGPVILSEFTGSASVFKGQELSVNPWDYQRCAEAIKRALEMDESEKETRYNKMRDVVLHQTGEEWVISLKKELARVHEEHFQRDTMSVPRLSAQQLVSRYKASQSRVFILDYEGTLVSHSSFGTTSTAVHLSSPQRVLDALNDVLMDEGNIVYVMSGRKPEELEMLFSRVYGLGLIAENGCFIRECNNDVWTEAAPLEKMAGWKDSVRSILKYFQERVEGSEIEERHCSMIFHYHKCPDMEAAGRQAGECANHINDACGNQRVRAVPIDKSVVVEPLDWSKASAASSIFDKLQGGSKSPDFLMVAGNDREDEAVFHWANGLQKQGAVKNVTTVSVGKRNTEAMATLTQGTTGLLAVLQRLTKVT